MKEARTPLAYTAFLRGVTLTPSGSPSPSSHQVPDRTITEPRDQKIGEQADLGGEVTAWGVDDGEH